MSTTLNRVNAISPFRFTLDEGISRALAPLARGRVVDQALIDEAWKLVIGEIMNACDTHAVVITERASTWLADAYFRLAIKLRLEDGTNAFDALKSTNNVELSSLTDDDVAALATHLRGSVFEREVADERKSRG